MAGGSLESKQTFNTQESAALWVQGNYANIQAEIERITLAINDLNTSIEQLSILTHRDQINSFIRARKDLRISLAKLNVNLAEAESRAGSSYSTSSRISSLRSLDPDVIRDKYTPFMNYAKSKSANKNGTYFKLGPIELGGEVQQVRIVEDKALEIQKGIRSNSDFITSSGLGNADIEVTLVFNDNASVVNLLRPIISMFRVAPIISVQNEIINKALYDKFTENTVIKPKIAVANDITDALNDAMITERRNALVNAWNTAYPNDTKTFNELRDTFIDPITRRPKNQARWEIMLNSGVISSRFEAYQTMTEWIEDEDKSKIESTDRPVNAIDRTTEDDGEADLNANTVPYSDPRRALDQTNHVPVAFIGIELRTHPEFPEVITAVLHLKRISIGNYLKDYLQYRSFDSTPTSDPTDAFWLIRAMQIYMDRFLEPNLIISSQSGRIDINFRGEDVELLRFKDNHNLKSLKPNTPYRFSDIATTQMSYAVEHKFAFHRLIGEAYPTAQHLGTSTGILTMAIKMDDTPDKTREFKKIHEFKNAADFFSRHTDKATRINGWSVDCILTRLFNLKENPFATDGDSALRNFQQNSFYPKSVVSDTSPTNPNVKDISISFLEMNPDFFSNYGFTVRKSGFNLDILHEFYLRLVSRAKKYKQNEDSIENEDEGPDFYSFNVLWGRGDPETSSHIINADTIMSTFLEVSEFSQGTSKISTTDIEPDAVPRQILDYLLNNSKFSGVLDVQGAGFEVVLKQLGSLPGAFFDIKLPRSIATRIAEKYFEIPVSIQAAGPIGANIIQADILAKRQLLITHLQGLPEASGRRDLYSYLYNNRDIRLNDLFYERLFATVVRRAKVRSSRLFDRVGVAKAFNILSIALETTGADIAPDLSEKLSKRKTDDTKIVVDSEGRIDASKTNVSAYSDYMYLTYEDLFDLPEPGLEGNWHQYQYTYQDLGIFNVSVDAYSKSDSDSHSVFSSDSVTKAMSHPVTQANSPVPPSIFFHREREAEEFRNNLDNTTEDYFNKISTLTLDIPFDIRIDKRDSFNRYTSEKAVDETVTDSYINEDDLDAADLRAPYSIRETSEIIERGAKKLASTRPDITKEFAEDIVLYELTQLSEKTGITREEIARRAKDGSLPDNFYTQLSRFYRVRKDGINFPIIVGTHLKSPVTEYRTLAGVRGEGIARILVNASIVQQPGDTLDSARKRFIDQTIMKSASGSDDGISISSSDMDEVKTAMLKITQGIADNRNDIIKAFPTFRLYFIDFRGPRILVRDNFYGYNAIQSIDITHDKNDPSLAVIRIADPLHILQGDLHGVEPNSKSAIDDVGLVNVESDVEQSHILDRLTLRQGRAIQIRGGYAAEPENLDIIFTGRIAEIQYGDIVTVVAQGWKAELITKQVEFELHSVSNRSVKDLVTTVIRRAAPAGMGDIFSYEELQSIKALKNKLSTQEGIDQAIVQGSGTTPISHTGVSGTTGVTIWGYNFFGGYYAGLDLRLRNVWVPDVENVHFRGFAAILNVGWQGRGWVVPLQPAWHVLQNATNYVWGYICQVVPYDGESTLFFGRPDQMYHFSNGTSSVSKEYRQLKLAATADVEESFSKIVREFTNTHYFNKNNFRELGIPPGKIELQDTLGHPIHITSPLTISYYNPYKIELNPIQPDDSSYRLYKAALINSSSSGLQQRLRGFFGEPTNFNPIVEGNYNADFQPYLRNIADALTGGDIKDTALLMLASFYGITPEYINIHFPIDTKYIIEKIMLGRRPDQVKLVALLGGVLPTAKAQSLTVTNAEVTIDEALAAKHNLFGNSQAWQDLKDNYSTSTNVANPSRGSIEVTFVTDVYRSSSTKLPAGREAAALDYLRAIRDAYALMHKGQRDVIIGSVNKPSFFTSKVLSIQGSDLTANKSLEDLAQLAVRSLDRMSQETAVISPLLISSNFAELSKELLNESLSLSISQSSQTDIIQLIYESLPLFRAYVYYFSKFVNDNNAQVELQEYFNILKTSNVFDWPKAINMKVFRDYHFISDYNDIIENNIAASTREMHNTVVVRHPEELPATHEHFLPATDDFETVNLTNETEWVSWPPADRGIIGLQFNDSITYKDKKVAIHTDLNCARKESAAKVATNVLTKLIRPMYRNNLLVLGRNIKPWDHIYLNDKYTDMRGMLDVERIVHHYDVSKGWVTNIVPHAVCEANPGSRVIQDAIFADKMDFIYDVVDFMFDAFIVITALETAGASIGVASAARVSTKQALSQGKKALGRKSFQGLGKRLAVVKNNFYKNGGLAEFRSLVANNSATVLKTYLVKETASYGYGEINRLLITNSGIGSDRLPVIFMPLLFKGAPLQAGLHGEETEYFSVGSQLHWSYKDTLDGVEQFLDIITGPPSSDTSQLIEGLSRIQ